MDVGSDTFPRDEVTGLAAFDDLDPVSTVSTLAFMPEPPAAPTPRIFTPPPPPNSVVGSVLAARPSMPPNAQSARTFSRPPSLPPTAAARASLPPPVSARVSMPPSAAVPAEAYRADATEVVDIPADAQNGDAFESWEDPEDAATRVAHPMSDGRPAPSAELHMDWDEEEPPTQMRGEGGVSAPRAVLDVDWEDENVDTRLRDESSTSAYQPAQESGRPSPFPTARASSAGSVAAYSRSGAPSPFVASTADTAWGQDLRTDNRTYWLIGVGAFAIIALGFALRAFFAVEAPGLVTLTTVPGDARVVVDGRPVSGTSSPFSATDLKVGVPHELVVQKDGFVEHRSTFTLAEGEAKTLPEVNLVAIARDMGLVVSSEPAGAKVLVDGQDTGKITPARITELSAGLHKVELVQDGFARFEVQALVPQNEMLELPSVQLAAARGKASSLVSASSDSAAASEKSASAREERSSASSSSRRHHRSRSSSASPSSSSSSKRAARVSAPKRSVLKAAAPVTGKGILRVNSRPWAQVFVDGKLMGNTPQMAIQLAPGDHKLKLVNGPMGLTKTLSVNVKSGQTVTKVLNLIE